MRQAAEYSLFGNDAKFSVLNYSFAETLKGKLGILLEDFYPISMYYS
jgi:hypothetical protein